MRARRGHKTICWASRRLRRLSRRPTAGLDRHTLQRFLRRRRRRSKRRRARLSKRQKQTPASAERTQPFYWLDRKSLVFGLVQGGAEIFDGVTTRYFIHHCSLCFENDPMSRLLLGTHPSWGKMIPMGIGEAALSTYSYRRLSHSPNRLLRGAAPFVPIGLTAVHVIEGARNITLKNNYRCADPGYVVVGAICVAGDRRSRVTFRPRMGRGTAHQLNGEAKRALPNFASHFRLLLP